MKKSSNNGSFGKRVLAVFLIILVFPFLLSVANLFKIQTIDSEKYKSKAEQNQLRDTEISAERGIIYDANGTVLAQSASVWKLYINPSKITDENFKAEVCSKLAELTGVDEQDIADKAAKNKYNYLVIKRRIELAEKESIQKLLDGVKNADGAYTQKPYFQKEVDGKNKRFYYSDAIGLDPDVKRYYPYGSLAACVIGFTGDDDVGRSGLELKYNDTLTGTPGRIVKALNGKSGAMDDQYESVYDAVRGTSLVLTVNEVIQRYLTDSLEQVYADSKGKGAYGVVMNVNTGAILAMACVEDYDLNDPQHLTDEEKDYIAAEGEKGDSSELTASQEKEIETNNSTVEERAAARRKVIRNNLLFKKWRNFITSDIYDPGSVFKIITASAGLEENVVTPETSYTCTGKIQVADRTIKCHKRTGHGTQDLTHGLMNSCNPFFITVGQKLGAEKFCEYFEAFGFTEKTGIDLPAETMPVAGVNYHTLDTMGIVELSSSSFGQSFQVTPIQMITAISAIANGGKLMTPYVVAKQLDENGNVVSETQPNVRRQVISKQTANIVAGMMEQVVTSGTGKNAYVAGYRVAGKTGTSQKLNNVGHYVASFGCFAPADDPEIAVLIIVDDPVGQINGGQICTPVAAQVVEKSLEYMGVEREYTDSEMKLLDTNAPNLVGSTVGDAKALLEQEGFSVKTVGKGDKVISQMPSYNQTMPQDGIIVLYTEQDADRLTATVPDFRGMTMSQVNKLAHSSGLNIRISGNALNAGELVSYDQSIEAGAETEYGRTVTVYFKSNTGVNDYAD